MKTLLEIAMTTTTPPPQVDASHYTFARYMTKRRWNSYWHQIDELLRLAPETVLEIGPGRGHTKAVLAQFGVDVRTVDIDPVLKPDIVGSALNIPANDESADVSCAFQVLEHFPFEDSRLAFRELARVARSHIVISLPDSRKRWPFSFYIPKFGSKDIIVSVPHFPKQHQFDGEHYWELNAKGYDEATVIESFVEDTGCLLVRKYTVVQNPYHRFMIFKKVS